MFSRYLTIKNLAFLLGLVAILYIMPKITGIVLLFFAAYVLSCALNPYVEKLQKKLHNNRNLASVIVVFGGILSVMALFAPIIAIAYKEIKTFVRMFPEKITDAAQYVASIKLYGHKLADLINLNSIMNTNSEFAQNLFSQSWNFTIGIFQFFVVLVAMGMIIFYILCDKAYLRKKFIDLFPINLKEKANFILSSISSKVGGYVRAQVLSMGAIGVMQFIVLLLLGVEYPLLLGLITGILDIVPVLGPTIALVVILLVAYPVGIIKFILIIVTFILVQQASNIIVRPLLFGKFMELHPLMIFFALFVAEQFLGFWGMILSPAIAATVCVLIDELYINPINSKAEECGENG